ncbi:MAG: HAMP domain-containing protein [Gammaproteobacteria bacterium]|nr:HAMP domain-containing protein [Gammaproteobacteria bacterium]
MHFNIITKSQIRIILVVLLFCVLLTALLVISDALQDSTRFGHLYSPLLLLSSAGLLILISLIALNLQRLRSQVRKGLAGARLTVRLVVTFIFLAAIPVLIVYYFSMEFLHQRLDNWFDVQIEQALADALELSRASLDVQMRNALRSTQQLAVEMTGIDDQLVALHLNELRERSGAAELALLASNGLVIAFNNAEMARLLPTRPDDSVLSQLKQQPDYIDLELIPEQGLHIRAVALCLSDTNAQTAPKRFLHALFPVAARINLLAGNVESAVADYKQLAYMRKHLKDSVTLILSLVLLLSISGAVWMAFIAARRLVAPIRDLAEGTRAVARGDYDKQLPENKLDELGFLVQSFNEMTRKIGLARDEVRHRRQQADAQRRYLEIILERLSSGVLSLDHERRLRTSNAAAEQILGLPLDTLTGRDFVNLCANDPQFKPLCQTMDPYMHKNGSDWQEQLTLFGTNGRKILMCRGTRLPASGEDAKDEQSSGYVLVFDDVTTLIQAQRDAAWSEVARRLAHEIKNPLTPIQLCAERLRHKFLPALSGKEAKTLDRMTHTIVQQVESMKEMVNAFSDYARIPQIRRERLSINQLINEVLDLYRLEGTRIKTRLDKQLPKLEADPGRLRQVLHNLIKNALEAKSAAPIIVSTRYRQESNFSFVELTVKDQGPGVPENLLDRVFEPYVTSKTKGTGLGLAIVKKIVEEHGGMVWLENNAGARIVIHLPVVRLPAVINTLPPRQLKAYSQPA